jgi:hypothetical protein
VTLIKKHVVLAQGVLTQEEAAYARIDKGEIDNAVEILKRTLEASPYNFNAKLYLSWYRFLSEEGYRSCFSDI